MMTSSPAGKVVLVTPRRSNVLGLPPSNIQISLVPSGLIISTWIQVCGLTHSIFTILPLTRTGALESNSDPNAWCAAAGCEVINNRTALHKSDVRSFVRIEYLQLICWFRI